MNPTPRELDTILAALLWWQYIHDPKQDEPPTPLVDLIASAHGAPLDATEIDRLCERLNASKEDPLLHHLRILAAEDSQCAHDWVEKKKAARAAIAEAEAQ